MAQGIQSARKWLLDVKTIFEQSFGPSGKDILLKSSTGFIHVTKNGLSVLRQLEINHPIGLIIKQNAEYFAQSAGDLCKTYVILLTYLMEAMFYHYIDDMSTHKPKDLQSLLSQVSKSILVINSSLTLESVSSFFRKHVNLLDCSLTDLSSTYLDGILNISLGNQFSLIISNVLQRIIKDIFKLMLFSKNNLNYLINHYQSVCINVYGLPLNLSWVVSGIIIERECVPSTVEYSNCRFILLSGALLRSSGKNLCIDLTDGNFFKQHNNLILFYQKILNTLKKFKVNVVFAEEALPTHFSNLLESSGITYAQHVSEDDLKKLCRLYGISVLSGLYDISCLYDKLNLTGKASFFKVCRLGKQLCCHLGPDVTSQQKSVQILLCSTSQGIGIAYAESILNTFKVLYQCLNTESDACSLVPACGVFEILFSEYCLTLGRYTAYEKEMLTILSNSLLGIPKLIFNNSSKQNTKRYFPKFRHHNCVYGVDGYSGDTVEASNVKLYEPFNSKVSLLKNLLELCSQIIRIDLIIPVIRPPCKPLIDVSEKEESLE